MTAPTLTLADFLLLRIAEDEEWATSAWAEQSHAGGCDTCGASFPRLLAECEVRRRLVEMHSESGHECIEYSLGVPIYPAADFMTINGVMIPGCQTLRLLALPYADHQDYRDEWRP